MTAIFVENLIKQYQTGVKAINGLSLTVPKGTIFSLLGPNGAGKSTLIHILTTCLFPTSGNVTLLGKNIYKDIPAIRSKIACVTQKISIDTHLSLTENMMFQSKLYKIPKKEATQRMKNLISYFDLEQYSSYPVSSYSGGIKRKLDITLNLMSNPDILFLDEPTVGMDVLSRKILWDMIKKIQKEFGTTIFFTTHYLEEASHLSDKICIMKDGTSVAQGTPSALRNYLKKEKLKITFASKEEAQTTEYRMASVFIGRKLEVEEESLLIPIEKEQLDLEQAGLFLFQHHIPFLGLEVLQPTIETIFLHLTDTKPSFVPADNTF